MHNMLHRAKHRYQKKRLLRCFFTRAIFVMAVTYAAVR